MAKITDFPKQMKKEVFDWNKPFKQLCEEMSQFVNERKGALNLDFIKDDMLYTIIVRSAIDFPKNIKKEK